LILKETEKWFNQNWLPEVKLEHPTETIFEVPEINTNGIEDFKIFGFAFDYDSSIDWHLDISSMKRFPRSYSKEIDIRTDQFGSAKHVWEVNRLQFLPTICYRYRLSCEEKYLNQFMEIHRSWLRDNPYLIGVNWHSNIEINIRLIGWFLCWELLGVNELQKKNKEFAEFVSQTWLPLIYMHCKFSFENPSKYSSANNHLISEGAGLFVASSLWKFKESEKWNRYAKRVLELEILKQHSINGVNREEASEYIQFITDFFLIAYVVGEATSNNFTTEYKQMLKNIFSYIYNLMNFQGSVPYYGDEDDGRCFILESDNNFNNFRSLLTSATVLFNSAEFKSKSNGWDLKNSVLFGDRGKSVFDQIGINSSVEKSSFYEEEGHFICKNGNKHNQVYLHFDAAPLGYLSIAAHGHADALSIYLEVLGQPVLIDSGTYTYHTYFQLRKYFIGTLAHNTIRVDKLNQALICGPTLWRDHYQCNVLKAQTDLKRDHIIAQHNGYNKSGVIHCREIDFDKELNRILIIDTLKIMDTRMHFFELPFHVHPDLNVKPLDNGKYQLTSKRGFSVSIELDKQLEPVIIEGRENEPIGWYSPRFGEIEQCPVIYSCLSSAKTLRLVTEIKVNPMDSHA
jgi:hypothetical protein